MYDDYDDDEASARATTAAPQRPVMTMLFSNDDLQTHVLRDTTNLCCVLVTSTLCAHSGVRTLHYPAVRADHVTGMLTTTGTNAADDNDNDNEDDQDSDDARAPDVTVRLRDLPHRGSGSRSTFYADVLRHVVQTSPRHATQRRHVRFFHVCACTEAQTNVRPLIARDAAFALSGHTPSAAELAELHATAYAQLTALLRSLAVRSTPCMLFFVRGQRLRYSAVNAATTTTTGATATTTADGNDTDDADMLVATGCNHRKWQKVLHNAIVLRNALLREHDAAVRAAAQQARREARQRARAARRLARQQQRQRNDDDEDDDDDDDDA